MSNRREPTAGCRRSREDRAAHASPGTGDRIDRFIDIAAERRNTPVSNFPLSYTLSWLPRFLRPSLRGDADGFAGSGEALLAPLPSRTVRLAFVGDISAVASGQAPACAPALAALLASADLVVGNCESPVVERPANRLGTALGTHHAMTRRFLAEAISACGMEAGRLALSVANNHALDQGRAGFDETVSTLREMGVAVIGKAGTPVHLVDAGGIRLGLSAFTLWRNAGADDFEERVSMAPPVRVDVAEADLLCAIPHWDWEFRHRPRPETRALARRLTEQGFGLVVGHHAHVVQPAERFGPALAVYGLGDFLGTAFARQPWPGRISAVLAVDVSAEGETRGRIAAYSLHFLVRLRDGRRERLVPVEEAPPSLRAKVRARLDILFGPGLFVSGAGAT